MIILGIDPGSRSAGYGLIEVQARKLTYLASGTLKFDHIKEFMPRLGEVYRDAEMLLTKYRPDEIALESLIYVKNVSSLAKLSQARGAMLAAFCQTHAEKIFEYSPNLIKSSVTGHGHASKEGMEKTLKMILGSELQFKSNDESDALGVAVCHALNHGRPQIKSSSKTRKLRDIALRK
ncbi:MAG: crossover junction endodeoxyribonuclease RuvC [Halobacteriovoraceae bacterium]|jgi:crossover junction endodeoxyribonuclease RuvC|nr:crossover junction endodeoxyribonuclease RuvC [Halobacteriovoraceae bacterium]MBT5092810.1 crossover junction endodeoxyribonuclease RuvC [Halobacteriovoraceae bacterium]